MAYTNWTFKNVHNNIYYNILNSILFISAYFSCEGLHVLKKLQGRAMYCIWCITAQIVIRVYSAT